MIKKENGSSVGAWANRSYPIPEDMPFQQLEWRIERASWLLMAAVVVLAMAGLFSDGPISTTTPRDASGRLEIEHDRFYRNGAANEMYVRVAGSAQNETVIIMDPAFFHDFSITGVTPRPWEMRTTPEGIALIFKHEPQSPLLVSFQLRPVSLGLVGGTIGLAGATPIDLTAFTYP